MPNHCESDLDVSGAREDLDAFALFARSERGGEERLIDADRFIPYPEEFRKLDEAREEAMARAERGEVSRAAAWATRDGFNSGGYEWCCENWGTKWGVYFVKLERDERGDENEPRLRYSFQSAWSPPEPVIFAMSQRFPKLEFDLRYFECGNGFNGRYRVKAGVVVDDETGRYFGDRGG